jgi:hypothetical protein
MPEIPDRKLPDIRAILGVGSLLAAAVLLMAGSETTHPQFLKAADPLIVIGIVLAASWARKQPRF